MKKSTAPKRGMLIKVLAVILGIILLAELFLMTQTHDSKIQYGVSYSPGYATYLGLDWKQTYQQILDDLKVRALRLNTYWDTVQPSENEFDFSETDYLVSEAAKRQAKILLVVGYKQPRWPECHAPEWAKQLSLEKRRAKLLNYIEAVVNRYKSNQAVWAWQVENEPLFGFGEGCDPKDPQFLQTEIDLVRKLDPGRKIVVTDSGEWSLWTTSAKYPNLLGVSVYSRAYNDSLKAFVSYPFPAQFYSFKAWLAKTTSPNLENVILSELQAEPWFIKEVAQTPIEEQVKNFSINNFKTAINKSESIGFDRSYLWGIEWWFYIQNQGHPEYLEQAKTLF